jgi:hypothetical protein
MISKLGKAFGLACIATVLTQLILLGYFFTRGSVNGNTATQVIALLNGIDITGARLQKVLNEAEGHEQPDFDEILEARKLESLDMDMRLKSQQVFRDEMTALMMEVRDDRDRLDKRLASFRQELNEMETEALTKGLKEAGSMIQLLEAAQAKDQLLVMIDEERINDVLTIIQGMSAEKRKDILAEFVSEEEKKKLAQILRLISEGQPTTALIDGARSNR